MLVIVAEQRANAVVVLLDQFTCSGETQASERGGVDDSLDEVGGAHLANPFRETLCGAIRC